MMAKSIQEIQDEIIAEFSFLENRDDVYEYIIEIGKKAENLPEEYKVNENLIKGCQSKVWLAADLNAENEIVFRGDSDAMIVKGLVSLMIRVLSNQSPEAILNCELYFIEKIGMRQIISSSRSNGLTSMIKQMKLYALAYQTKIEREA